MGTVGGGEVLVILLVALIVLGPTKLPTAIRQVGRVLGEVRRIGAGFQQELRDATEPIREPLRETKATLQAADKELREAAKPLEETAATLKSADPRKAISSGAKDEGKPGDTGSADAGSGAADAESADADAADADAAESDPADTGSVDAGSVDLGSPGGPVAAVAAATSAEDEGVSAEDEGVSAEDETGGSDGAEGADDAAARGDGTP